MIETLTVNVNDLKSAEYNPRVKLEPGMEEYESLKKSILEFGLVDPPIYNKRTQTLVGGHQRVEVAKSLGIDTITVSVVDLPLDKEKALNLALNKISGRWDEHRLADMLEEIEAAEISLTGFNLKEVSDIVGRFEYQEDNEKVITEDKFETVKEYESIKKPKAQKGQLYKLGDHYLMCGDSTDPLDVETLMQGAKADLVVTDPPYNVAVESESESLHLGKTEAILNDDMSDAEFDEFLLKTFTSYRSLMKDETGIYVFHSSSYQREFENAMNANDIFVRSQCIWVKNSMTFGWSQYRWQHEPCFYAHIKKKAPKWYGDRKQSTVWRDDLLEDIPSTVWEVNRGDVNKYVHPTQKPLSLIAIPIRNSSRRGDVVVDLFGGSGSTLLACHELSRVCYTMELDGKFCDVILKRFEKHTGIKPELIN